MLWVDKYRPKDLDAMEVHKDLSGRLKRIVASGDFPHLLLYGPSGSGKKTRVMALLRHFFGHGAERLKAEHRSFKVSDSKTVELSTLSSSYHLELTPSEVGYYDRVVIMTLVKEVAETVAMDTRSGGTSKGFHVIVLNEVDHLSRGAQQALRRTMEKHMQNCRLVLLAATTSNLIAPLKSRCLAVRVPLPTAAEVTAVLERICKKEGLTLPPALAEAIASASGGNLRRAVLMLETCKVQQCPLSATQRVPLPDWQAYVQTAAADMLREQSPKVILEVRGKLYELLANCIPPEMILKELLVTLLRSLPPGPPGLQAEVIQWAAHYEHNLKLGSKPIFHLEAFVCKFMYLYRQAASVL